MRSNKILLEKMLLK